jgi:hypothetical protein
VRVVDMKPLLGRVPPKGWRTTLALREGLTRPQVCAVGAESVKRASGGSKS